MKLISSIKILIIGYVICLISSCEQGYSYNYILSNSTDTTISVNFKTFSLDTTLEVQPKETKQIYSTFHGMEGAGGPFRRDVKFDFDSIVVKKGKKKSIKDFRQNMAWKFAKKDDFHAEYQAIITDTEF